MATLNSGNITNGNTIEPNDILQLYDAFTPGGGTTGAYSVTVSGSLIGNASSATSASYALSSSFAVSSSRAVSSSFATTASYAANVGTSTSTTLYRAGTSAQASKPFAGSGTFSSGIANVDLSTQFPDLSYSALGGDLFVTAMAANNTEYVGVSFAGSTLTFRSSNGASTGTFYYMGWAK